MKIWLPRVYRINQHQGGSTIRQLDALGSVLDGSIADYHAPKLRGKVVLPESEGIDRILLVEKDVPSTTDFARVIRADLTALNLTGTDIDLTSFDWLKHPDSDTVPRSRANQSKLLRDVIASWGGAFLYVTENLERNIKGLRPPQIGAIHAVHSHWTVSTETATVVMPTGTGKTETMLSILVSVPCSKVLVIVPSDALRTQLADKFLTLGVLRGPDCTILQEDASFPVVGTLYKKPTTTQEIDTLFERCHVIVTTSHIAGQCEEFVQSRMAHHCPYLFIDEAHHTEAPTWQTFKRQFAARKVLQFTATPFREDGNVLDGKIVYEYPLKKAQKEGYFKPITFDPVNEFNLAIADHAIAAKAIQHLRADQTRKHIVMARVANVPRAVKVFGIYESYKEFNPVQLHTGIKSKAVRDEIRRNILSGQSRIIVCVDMLGEGFDLPELKIAAFHDIRESLAVTLQLAGRFTRARADLGNATFIANVADVDVRDELRRLYTRDPDWNQLLPEMSEEVIAEQVNLKEFVEGFSDFPDEIPLQRVRPATSTVIYKTRCQDWRPDRFREGIIGIDSMERVHSDVNHARRTLVVVTAKNYRSFGPTTTKSTTGTGSC